MSALEIIGAVGLGAVGGFITASLEPVQRRFGIAGRRVARDSGVQIHVETDPRILWAGMPPWIAADVFLPEVASHETPPDNALDWRSWAKELGGCDASEATARVTLIGLAPVTVVVSTPLFDASAAEHPDGIRAVRPVGGAEVRPRGIDVDLDTFGAENPIVNLGEESVDGPRMPSQWSLRQGDVEQFDLRVRLTTPSIVTWTARIPLLIDGRRKFIEVSDGDEPFRLAGCDGLPTQYWTGNEWSAA